MYKGNQAEVERRRKSLGLGHSDPWHIYILIGTPYREIRGDSYRFRAAIHLLLLRI